MVNPISEATEDNEIPAAPPEAEEGDGADDIGEDPGGGGGDDDFELPDAHEIGDAELAAEIPSAASIPAPLPAEVIVYSRFFTSCEAGQVLRKVKKRGKKKKKGHVTIKLVTIMSS